MPPPPPAAAEEAILSNFLLSPASLPTAITLQKFTELFPKRLQSHPQIKALYRELQQLREQDMDLVNANIDQEVHRGEEQMAQIRQARQMSGGVEDKSVATSTGDARREMDLDLHLFDEDQRWPAESPATATATAASTAYTDVEDAAAHFHTTASLLSAMEAACDTLERQIADIDSNAAAMLADLESTVGELSDLRYGKFHAGPGSGSADEVVSEAIKGLENLEDVCHAKSD